MNTDLLTLTQWLSPAFPLGSFAYSHGLETAITDGVIRDAPSLQGWLATILASGSGRVDAVLLSAARRGEDAAEVAVALAGSKERLEETVSQGAAFARTLRTLGHTVADAPLPVAVGQATQAFDLPTETVAALYLQNFASNLVQCAVRFVPLGQSEGQAVLNGLRPLIEETARNAAHTKLTDIATGAFMSDLSAMRHETQVARVFQS
ncbi:MAG: urease accessory UreF family protein [Pseudomonadota bacterium]